MTKKSLITGITGQDGSYLCELLLAKGYEVHGLIRRSSSFNTARIESFYQDPHLKDARMFLHYGDLTDGTSLSHLVKEIMPDEVYNLAAQSHVRVSFDIPVYTVQAGAMGTLQLLEAVRSAGNGAKFYQASSSEMYGKVREVPQTEQTPFYPRSPYGVSKVFGHYITVNYRESYDLFAVSGILFNHESPRRGMEFVTRKVTDGAARIKLGLQKKLHMGNLDAERDWGFAGDYVEAMWMMLQQKKADDYVISTGVAHSVRELCEVAFDHVGLNWKKHVVIDKQFIRPAEVAHLLGDSSKARKKLGWKPRVDFKGLVEMMVDADIERVEREIADSQR